MNIKDLAAEALKLIEQDGPAVLGLLLQELAPSLPVNALVDLASNVEKMILAGSEKSQMQAAVAALESADQAAVKVVP